MARAGHALRTHVTCHVPDVLAGSVPGPLASDTWGRGTTRSTTPTRSRPEVRRRGAARFCAAWRPSRRWVRSVPSVVPSHKPRGATVVHPHTASRRDPRHARPPVRPVSCGARGAPNRSSRSPSTTVPTLAGRRSSSRSSPGTTPERRSSSTAQPHASIRESPARSSRAVTRSDRTAGTTRTSHATRRPNVSTTSPARTKRSSTSPAQPRAGCARLTDAWMHPCSTRQPSSTTTSPCGRTTCRLTALRPRSTGISRQRAPAWSSFATTDVALRPSRSTPRSSGSCARSRSAACAS